MKKLITLLLLAVLSIPVFCQDDESVLVNKNGIRILPEKGNISIGIDAVPFLNMLKDNVTSPGFNFVNNIPTLSFKYFISDRSALRFDILANYTIIKDGNETLSDYTKLESTDIGFNFGYEWRHGKSRVQGFYGIEGGAIYGKGNIGEDNELSVEISSIGVGIDGFLGVEYFLAPKLSIGGMFSWGPSYAIVHNIENHTKTSVLTISAENLAGALILAFAF